MRPQHPAPAAAMAADPPFTAARGAGRTPLPRRPSAKENRPPSEQVTLVRRSSAQSQHGHLQFFLQRIAGGLYVEREETPRHGIRSHLAVCFVDWISFERWCDDDAVRFEYPVLHQRVKRDGQALWQIEA
jgi:hypothetical protein